MTKLGMTIASVLVAGSGSSAGAQSLISNGSFEEYSECPQYVSWWAVVSEWTSAPYASADYFNRCDQTGEVSVPSNTCGVQEAKHGDAYMGIATIAGGDIGGGMGYREYIACQLDAPLVVGVPVYISFYTSPGGFAIWPDANSAHWRAKGPGVQFWNEIPNNNDDLQERLERTMNTAAVHMPGVLGDTSTWTHVSGSYVPDSAYNYLVIANFFADSLSMKELQDPEGDLPGAYAFIDQVCVSYDSTYCDSWTGLEQPDGFEAWVVENPVLDELHIRRRERLGPVSIEIIDLAGVVKWRGGIVAGAEQVSFNVSDLVPGMYVLHWLDGADALRTLKLLHLTP